MEPHETDQIREWVQGLFVSAEQRLDAQEEIIANLLRAYTEIASFLEGLTNEVMNPRSDEEKQEFMRQVNERYATTLQMINEVAREVAPRPPRDPSASILSMVSQQPSSNPDDGEQGSSSSSQ